MRMRVKIAQHNGTALTEREMDIVRLVARGLRNKVIARQLLITEGTVKIHLHNIYQKLSLNGRFALSLYARDRNLVNNILAQVLALLGVLSGS